MKWACSHSRVAWPFGGEHQRLAEAANAVACRVARQNRRRSAGSARQNPRLRQTARSASGEPAAAPRADIPAGSGPAPGFRHARDGASRRSAGAARPARVRSPALFQSEQFLRDEGLRQARIALQHHDDLAALRQGSTHAFDDGEMRAATRRSSQSPTISRDMHSPSSLRSGLLCDGGAAVGQRLQRGGKAQRVVGLLRQQHLDQPEFGGATGADQLLLARR